MLHNTSLLITQLLLAKVHHLAALIALGFGLIAMAVPKKSPGHRRNGQIALVAMAVLIALALLLLATYLLPDNPSRARGAQLLIYLLVLAWMAAYSLLAGYRWASPRGDFQERCHSWATVQAACTNGSCPGSPSSSGG
jgi:hypothetical protein